jgi:hypothetical protein
MARRRAAMDRLRLVELVIDIAALAVAVYAVVRG